MFMKFLLIPVLFIFSSAVISDQVSGKVGVPDIDQSLPGGNFQLHSSQGDFSLDQLKDRVVLLYFGYTRCPDICPTSLSIIAQALNELSQEELKSVKGVFVSVDPKRDSYQDLDEYVRYFHPNLMAVTGSEEEIAQVARQYGAQYQAVPLEGSAMDYAIDHSAVIYLINPEGDLRFIFPHGTPAFVILEAIRYALTNGK